LKAWLHLNAQIKEWDGPTSVKPVDPMSTGDTAGDISVTNASTLNVDNISKIKGKHPTTTAPFARVHQIHPRLNGQRRQRGRPVRSVGTCVLETGHHVFGDLSVAEWVVLCRLVHGIGVFLIRRVLLD
jgi:hypothetical protein